MGLPTNNHLNKVIAPVIVAVCLVAYYGIGVAVLFAFDLPNVIKVIALVVSVIITVVIVAVLIERIKEIHEGEEDDLSKY
jgi:zinc transporter ZupT